VFFVIIFLIGGFVRRRRKTDKADDWDPSSLGGSILRPHSFDDDAKVESDSSEREDRGRTKEDDELSSFGAGVFKPNDYD